MMGEDKLDKEQRIRLEALNQANQRVMMHPSMAEPHFWKMVRDFRNYIATGNKDDTN